MELRITQKDKITEMNGTLEDIIALLVAKKPNNCVCEQSTKTFKNINSSIDRIMKYERWSDSGQDWVEVSAMDTPYMINSLRKLMREEKAKDLLNSEEFMSLILNIADRIIEDL